jgi:trans-aconitate 2-methyltransferase
MFFWRRYAKLRVARLFAAPWPGLPRKALNRGSFACSFLHPSQYKINGINFVVILSHPTNLYIVFLIVGAHDKYVAPLARIKRSIVLEDWNARQYLQFESERTRPAIDLLARVAVQGAKRVIDLGCGPGNSTELLARRFPQAEIVGVDSSDDMIGEARARLPHVKFESADIVHWRSGEPCDLIFANAVLQWVPDHVSLMTRLMVQLTHGGSLAVQMPDNFEEPSHVLMREVAARMSFRDKLHDANTARETIGAFAVYFAALAPHSIDIDVWRTTYVHALPNPDAIVEWMKGTGLRPFLSPLAPDQRQTFLAQYREAIAAAYLPLADGRVLLPFPRLFIVATRGESPRAKN